MKKNICPILLFGFILLTMTSCKALIENQNEIMKSWMGHHYSELIMKWGPPSEIINGPSESYIIIYTYSYEVYQAKSTTYITGTYNNDYLRAHAKTTYTPAMQYTKYRMFNINSQGYIVGWSWKGL